MFLTTIRRSFQAWLTSQHDRRQQKKRFNALVRWVLASQDEPLDLVEWREAGRTHLVAYCTRGRLCAKRYFLCLIHVPSASLEDIRKLRSSLEHWSIEATEEAVNITLCHSLFSAASDACTFLRFRPDEGRFRANAAAQLKYWGTTNY
jgi:hypothetical protein